MEWTERRTGWQFLCGAVLPATVCALISKILIQYVLNTYVSIDLCACMFVCIISTHVCMFVCVPGRVLACWHAMHLQLSFQPCYSGALLG